MTAKLHGLLRDAQSGDAVALDCLLYLHFDPLMAFVRSQLSAAARNAQVAEDIVQEAMVAIVAKLKDFSLPAEVTDDASEDGGLLAWMCEFARLRTLQYVRRLGAKRRGGDQNVVSEAADIDGEMVQILSLLSAGSRTPSRSLARREAIDAVRVALDSLDVDYREALEMRYLRDKSIPEIAAHLKRAAPSVRVLISRGVRQLRKRMDGTHFLSSNG